mgnify:CR=1 FL=1
MVNTKKIEEAGIDLLSQVIRKHKLLEPNLYKNDKTPSEDGYIYILKDDSTKKEDILEKIPVQVKSSQKKTKRNKFILDVNDLKYYANNGGTFLFVVYISEELDLEEIYFRQLPPLSLKKINKNLKKLKIQKTITLDIYQLEQEEIYHELCDYMEVRRQQIENLGKAFQSLDEVQENDVMIVSFTGEHPKSIFDYQKKHDVFPRVRIPRRGIEIPFEKNIKITAIIEEVDFEVKIGEKFTYKVDKKTTKSNDQVEIHLDNGLFLEVNKNKISLNAQEPKELSKAISYLEVMEHFFEKKYIYIDNQRFIFPKDCITPKNIKKIGDRLQGLKEVQNILNQLGISKELMVDKFDTVSQENLRAIEKSILENEIVNVTRQTENCLARLKIGNLYYIAIFLSMESNRGKLFDILDKSRKYAYKTEEEKPKEISIFELMRVSDWAKGDNIDYREVIKSFKKYEKGRTINDPLIKIIAGSDIAEYEERRNQLYDLALELAKWNIENSENKIFPTINYFQIVKRKRKLTSEESNMLNEILIQNHNNFLVGFGCTVLLGAKSQADFYFNKMSIEEQKSCRKFPIFKLYMELE